jgi:hypothetical protein
MSNMNGKISHTCDDESIEAKVEWFRSLSIEERMDLLCCYTNLALELNPELMEKKDDQPFGRRIQILSKI